MAGLRRSPRSRPLSLGQNTTALGVRGHRPRRKGRVPTEGKPAGEGGWKWREWAGGSTGRGSKFGEIRNPETFPQLCPQDEIPVPFPAGTTSPKVRGSPAPLKTANAPPALGPLFQHCHRGSWRADEKPFHQKTIHLGVNWVPVMNWKKDSYEKGDSSVVPNGKKQGIAPGITSRGIDFGKSVPIKE